MGILPMCVSMHHRCVWYPQGTEDVGSPGLELKVVASHHVWCLGFEPGSNGRAAGAISQPQEKKFNAERGHGHRLSRGAGRCWENTVKLRRRKQTPWRARAGLGAKFWWQRQ